MAVVQRFLPPLIFLAVLGWAALVLNCNAVLVWRQAKPSTLVAGATAELTCWYFTGKGLTEESHVYAVYTFHGEVGCSFLKGVPRIW